MNEKITKNKNYGCCVLSFGYVWQEKLYWMWLTFSVLLASIMSVRMDYNWTVCKGSVQVIIAVVILVVFVVSTPVSASSSSVCSMCSVCVCVCMWLLLRWFIVAIDVWIKSIPLWIPYHLLCTEPINSLSMVEHWCAHKFAFSWFLPGAADVVVIVRVESGSGDGDGFVKNDYW